VANHSVHPIDHHVVRRVTCLSGFLEGLLAK